MQALTESGVVGVRCAGAAHFMDVAWKRAFETGQYAGPRVFAAGYFLTTTGGHFLTSGHARECDGPYGFVRAIREQIKNGVDHIKLNLTGGIMGPAWDRHSQAFLLDDELEAAFAICHQRGFRVMAHAASPETVQAAARLGAHSVEHGYIMDAASIESLRAHRTWYVPTLAITQLTPDQARDPWEKRWVEQRDLAPDLCLRAPTTAAEPHREAFRQALAAGVRMALGSDIRPLKDAALLELGLWVAAGATPWQALLGATRHAAELCGVGDELGTIEPGKLADLIVVAATHSRTSPTCAGCSSCSRMGESSRTSAAPARQPPRRTLGMTTIDPVWAGVAALSQAFGARTLSPVDAVDALLERIRRRDGRLHAFIAVYADEARLAAEGADRGHPLRPPRSARSTACRSRSRISSISRAASPPAARRSGPHASRRSPPPSPSGAIAAGMIVLGKTHTVEFAMGSWGTNTHMGTPRNPWDLDGAPHARAAPRAAPASRWPRGWPRSPSAPTPAARCGCPRPGAASWA